MSRIVILRNNDTFYITDAQAENLYQQVNKNPNLRLLKILTGTGYRYISPVSIIDIKKGLGEDYRSDEKVIEDQRAALRQLSKAEQKYVSDGSDGIIGLLASSN